MQAHVLLGVIARSTLVKLLAHLEVMTAVHHGGLGGRSSSAIGLEGLATVSSCCSAIGLSPFDSIPEARPLSRPPASAP